MHATTIVGYTYRADNCCPDCVEYAMGVGRDPAEQDLTVETLLDRVAAERGVNRQDERSFDSDNFPKVIFADQVHDVCNAANGYDPGQCGDRCGRCGQSLGFDCPNVPDNG